MRFSIAIPRGGKEGKDASDDAPVGELTRKAAADDRPQGSSGGSTLALPAATAFKGAALELLRS